MNEKTEETMKTQHGIDTGTGPRTDPRTDPRTGPGTDLGIDLGIDLSVLADLNTTLSTDPAWRVARNAATAANVEKLTLDRGILASTDHSVSVKLDSWAAADQQRSGRCWIFAGLNSLRGDAMAETGIKDLEFSQAWLHYWDKLEKANYLLTAMVELADRPLDDRTVQHLLDHPAEDGGQWTMFVALVEKYGVVPKYAMPETWSSSHTTKMNRDIATATRAGALRIRTAINGGGDGSAALREAVSDIHRILTAHLGVPPEEFQWQYRDAEDNFHREGPLTPREFAARYLPADLGDYVCVVNDPRESSPYGELFTVEYLGNVITASGAEPVTYLNAPMDVLKSAAADALSAGRPVWFGCDTVAQSDRDSGVWDAHLHDYSGFYGVELGVDALDKRQRLLTGESLMTHAMVLTGVDLDDSGVPLRWRVENSWGDKTADKGFWTMNDSWFDEYVFVIAVHRDRLPEAYRAALDSKPRTLPAWDPMGALAH